MNEADTSYFLPYQEAWINDDSPLKVAEKSRRVGFTYASSYRMFQKCMRRGKGFTQWVSSRDRLTAQELIRDYIAMWCKLANVAAKGMTGEDVEVIDPEKDKIYHFGDEPGPVLSELYHALRDIQFGRAEDTHGWCEVID